MPYFSKFANSGFFGSSSTKRCRFKHLKYNNNIVYVQVINISVRCIETEHINTNGNTTKIIMTGTTVSIALKSK